ncbi:hypothetical protein [Nonomuraea sp. NPDC049750]|uniref:hypothetical protein n=1 Tax=Nonomuraea sp. NPDC049750 TaxID=3154738 RepID=UPI0033E4D832
MLVSGLTCLLGFLLGYFTGLDSGEATAAPAETPPVTMTIGDSTPPADQGTDPSAPAGAPTSDPSAPAGAVTSAPVALPGTATSGPAASTPAGTSAPLGTAAPTGAAAPVGSAGPPGALGGMRTLIVGVDIQPGTYRTTGPATATDTCYWARMKSTSAQLGDVIAADMPKGPATVTILATDKALQTGGCAPWTKS